MLSISVASLEIYKIQLQDTKKTINQLSLENNRARELVKEHADTIKSYMGKVTHFLTNSSTSQRN